MNLSFISRNTNQMHPSIFPKERLNIFFQPHFENGCSRNWKLTLKAGIVGRCVYFGELFPIIQIFWLLTTDKETKHRLASTNHYTYSETIEACNRCHIYVISTGLGLSQVYIWRTNKLPPVFQPSIGVRPMPTERTQHNAMMPFALCPVTRLLYLNGWAEQNDTVFYLIALW